MARKKKKEIDNLAMDAAEALAAGTSYGKWKPHHPNTREHREQGTMPCILVAKKYCVHCGKPIYRKFPKLYCSEECRRAADNAKYRERQKANKEAAACKD